MFDYNFSLRDRGALQDGGRGINQKCLKYDGSEVPFLK